jgi:multimeric flavodoxin WrbA
MKKILIINGSHRAGNTDILVKELVSSLKGASNDVRILTLREIEMKLPDGCADCANSEICKNVHDEFSEKIEPTIRSYDLYIIATPTWDDGVTPLTKIFWDRVVSWCHEDRIYLRNKKLAIMTHGMSGENSWKNVIEWVKSVCIWEEAEFGGSFTASSDAEIGTVQINRQKLDSFITSLVS